MTKKEGMSRRHIFISHQVRNSAYSDNPFLRRHVGNVRRRYRIRETVSLMESFLFPLDCIFRRRRRCGRAPYPPLEFHHGVSRILRDFACTYTWASAGAELRAVISVSFRGKPRNPWFVSPANIVVRQATSKILYLLSRPRVLRYQKVAFFLPLSLFLSFVRAFLSAAVNDDTVREILRVLKLTTNVICKIRKKYEIKINCSFDKLSCYIELPFITRSRCLLCSGNCISKILN